MNFRHVKSLRQLMIVLIAFLLLVPIGAQGAPLNQVPAPVPVDSAVLDQLKANGSSEYWVVMKDQADLSAAFQITDWNERGQYVYDQLTSLADKSQKPIDTIFRGNANATHKRFWIVNAIHVKSDQAVLDQIIHQPGVKEILSPITFSLPEPIPGTDESQVNGIEWNISRINAPLVWSTYGDTGQGIVVANIDTGVLYNHPALVKQYRGNLGNGTFDHNYNWYDPANICGTPSPCDNNGHGTHTMGIMVGSDGGANQIGVAPGARFIAAKGCEYDTCSDFALLASAQWMLAPTDLNGANPRPDLRPNIINNSWGDPSSNTWFQSMVHAWVASGIFPAFAAGNFGPNCGTSGSPGDYAESYAVGAFDLNNVIAGFSSRGPAIGTSLTKPNITAPGVNIRSSVSGPTNSYLSLSGTSMASPHLAGAVALIWSEVPSLVGNISATRDVLDRSAIDTADLTCGGTAANNNVWGQGKLDTFTAVSLAANRLSGFARDASSHPIAKATVTILGTSIPPVKTDANGFYRFPSIPSGTYEVKAGCNGAQIQHLVLDQNTANFNFTIPAQVDAFGYSCEVRAAQYIEDTTPLPLTGDDLSQKIDLPFSFRFYGQDYSSAWVCTNGYLSFQSGNCDNNNTPLPSTPAPNASIYPFWDNLNVDNSASVRTQVLANPTRFVVEWRNVSPPADPSKRVDFEVVLYESGQILTQYRNIAPDAWEQGSAATLGIENETGLVGLQFSYNQAAVGTPTFAVLYLQPYKSFLPIITK